MSKFDVKFEDNKLALGLDTNEDGEMLLKANVSLNEAIQEALKTGTPIKIEGAKVVDFSFTGAALKVSIDTDQDGEKLAEIEINLMEALDEAGVLK